jgi:citrate lyase subunit beta/citryl-CoA lyase
MSNRIQRSMLILPVHNSRFVEKAHLRGADAVVLDLEDSVPSGEKERARGLVRPSLEVAGKGGADVLVRVNSDPALLQEDLDAAIYPGLHAVFLPKVEGADQVADIEGLIRKLEQDRGLEPGSVKIALHVETPLGILRMQEIAASGMRAESMSLGVDDYCLSLGIQPSDEALELVFPLTMMVVASRARGISPLGICGTVAEFTKLERFEESASRARDLGCSGAYCIHPDQVGILNRIFSPAPGKVSYAQRVVAAFEKGLEQGRAAVNLDGRMVDTPVYKQAKAILERVAAIQEVELRKAEALRGIRTT